MTNNAGFFEKQFKLKEHGTDVRTEIMAGITTFMTMAYILIVNPLILADAGMSFNAVFSATCVSAVIATLVMAFGANLPFVLAPGMGLNAFFAYAVVLGMGYTWQFALTAVFIEGIIFLILTFFNVREAIVDSIPLNVKKAISVGIGLFIAFIGMANAGIIVDNPATLVSLGHVTSGTALLALIGLVVSGVLLAMNVRGALFIGIVIATLVGIPMGITTLPSKIIEFNPEFNLFAFEWENAFSLDMLVVLGTFLFVDMFDTIGTLVGVSTKAGLIDENGKVPGIKAALFADAVGTTVGACLGTSTVTTYVESASGVSEGGRTGMTALAAAAMFFIALFFAPLFIMIPGAATAPALILVGLFMMSPIKEIDLDDFTEAIPAFLTIIMMPLSYSIAEGIAFGIVSYVFLKLLTGRGKEASPVTFVIAILFVAKFVFA